MQSDIGSSETVHFERGEHSMKQAPSLLFLKPMRLAQQRAFPFLETKTQVLAVAGQNKMEKLMGIGPQ